MKIFDQIEPWPTKVNFVDDRNVMLGYDMDGQCCENFGWFIHSKPVTKLTNELIKRKTKRKNYVGWNFDVNYFNKIEDDGIVIFRIVRGKQQKFIHIYNIHNGYYSHGFNFNRAETSIQEGRI